MNVYWVAAAWVAMALLASLVSIRLGISVALVELLVGAVVGNIPGSAHVVLQTDFTNFLATLGSGVLTFLAGAEIDPHSLRRNWKAALSLGFVSFAAPFVGALLFARVVLGWTWHSAEIAGVALSTTSVAVVYAVMIESRLNLEEIGKLILAGCFVTDLGTVLALGGLFADFNWLLAVFVSVTAVAMWFMPAMTRLVMRTVGGRVSEPEIKFLCLVLFVLGGLASSARSEAVLPAYLIGLVVAGVFVRDRIIVDRLRTIAFALLTHSSSSAPGCSSTSPLWRPARDRTYTTLLMATGLTFGSIAALYGLTNHLISQEQYSVLVTVVILSAFVPTLIAQQWFEPDLDSLDEELEEAAGEEDLATCIISATVPSNRRGGQPRQKQTDTLVAAPRTDVATRSWRVSSMTSVPGGKRQLASHLRVTWRGRRSVQLTRSVERVYDLSAGPWSFGLMLGVLAQGLVVLHVVSSTALRAGCWRTWAT